jgi:hypothetical protein
MSGRLTLIRNSFAIVSLSMPQPELFPGGQIEVITIRIRGRDQAVIINK